LATVISRRPIHRVTTAGEGRPWNDANHLEDDVRAVVTDYRRWVAAAVPARPWERHRLDLSRSELVWPLLLAAYTQVDVWPRGRLNLGHVVGPRPVLALLYTATSLALVWRRRAPLAVLAAIVTADAAYYLGYGAPEGLGTVLPMMFALYAVGRYAAATTGYAAAPMLLLAIALHELTDPQFRLNGLEVILWAVVAAVWPLGYAFQRRAREALSLARHAEQLAVDRDEAARAAVAGERARIARELHDVVGHGISVAVLQLVAAAGLLDKGSLEPARARLGNAERSARDALAEMRRLLGLLDRGSEPSLAPKPGLGQLDRLVADTRAAGATVSLRVHGAPVELSPGLDLAAFRIVQESLTNVLKHARPPCADVLVTYRPDSLTIDVRDHGTTPAPPAPDGRGLAGMRERASLYGGDLHAGARPDGGYAVRAQLPLGA
jgi:signal transduction histidine kinase